MNASHTHTATGAGLLAAHQYGGKLNFRVPLSVAEDPEKLHAACMAHLTHPANLFGGGMSEDEARRFLARVPAFAGRNAAARVSMIPNGNSFSDGSREYIAPKEFEGLEISRASGALCTGETVRMHEVYPAPELLLVKRTSGGVNFWVCSTIFYS